MDNNDFWIKLWKIIGACFCVLVVSLAGCQSNTNYQTRVLIENGADPLAVACAFAREGSIYSCMVIAGKERK